MERDIQQQLDSLSEGTISRFATDLLAHTIALDVRTAQDGSEQMSSLVFGGVSSFYYVAERGDRRLKLIHHDPGDYLELTSITYSAHSLGEVRLCSSEDWLQGYSSTVTFILEIWDSILAIEATGVTLNGIDIL